MVRKFLSLRAFQRELTARGTPRTYITLMRDIAAGKLPATRAANKRWLVPRSALKQYAASAPGRRRRIRLDGVTYESVQEAARALGVSRQTIYNRLRAGR